MGFSAPRKGKVTTARFADAARGPGPLVLACVLGLWLAETSESVNRETRIQIPEVLGAELKVRSWS